MDQGSGSDQKRRIPPYGPVKGMVEGLQLLQRLSPTIVDEALLRTNKVAPNNEYKVLGALRYLDLVDDEGKPTDKSRLLKTRGPTYMLNLQDIVRQAYADLFSRMNLRDATRDRIHNFFVTEAKMGSEMAVKATRYFVQLCHLAGFEMGTDLQGGRQAGTTGRQRQAVARTKKPRVQEEVLAVEPGVAVTPAPAPAGLPLILAVTPEMASLGELDLEQLFKRMLRAWRRALEDSSY